MQGEEDHEYGEEEEEEREEHGGGKRPLIANVYYGAISIEILN